MGDTISSGARKLGQIKNTIRRDSLEAEFAVRIENKRKKNS